MPNLEYVSADLVSHRVTLNFDIRKIPFPDRYFDAIICNHVLEHIEDDVQAMRELRRVCRPGGWAILQVPIDPLELQTFEDSSIVAPQERQRLFGQFDHVRSYGYDYPDRLRACGWSVEVVPYTAHLEESQILRYGLTAEYDQQIFLCTNSDSEMVDSSRTSSAMSAQDTDVSSGNGRVRIVNSSLPWGRGV